MPRQPEESGRLCRPFVLENLTFPATDGRQSRPYTYWADHSISDGQL